jgi:hypothetical protein
MNTRLLEGAFAAAHVAVAYHTGIRPATTAGLLIGIEEAARTSKVRDADLLAMAVVSMAAQSDYSVEYERSARWALEGLLWTEKK